MELLYLSDLLNRARISPDRVKLIRHSASHPAAAVCLAEKRLLEFTAHQDKGFGKLGEYWMVFLGEGREQARFLACYQVMDEQPDTPDICPPGLPQMERKDYRGLRSYYRLKPIDLFREYENRMVISWKNPMQWNQKGSNDKTILAIQEQREQPFPGFEKLILPFEQLQAIVEEEYRYGKWQAAMQSVQAVYLIVDTVDGRQYVGSATGTDGLFGRWQGYVRTRHGGNNRLQELLNQHPERYRKFQFAVLQVFSKSAPEQDVLLAESHWKEALQTRKFGHNEN